MMCAGCRLRRKHEVWNKQFKERMRETQAALRKRQGGSGDGAGAAANVVANSSSFAKGGIKANAAPASPSVRKNNVMSNGDVVAPTTVDVKKMPDLTAPDLIHAADSDWVPGGGVLSPTGADGQKKKKGLFKSLGLRL
jgi:hypothetical protein